MVLRYAEDPKNSGPYLQLSNSVNLEQKTIVEEILYRCDFSLCNGPLIFSQIEAAVRDLYDLRPFFAAFNISIESLDQSMTPRLSSMSTTSTESSTNGQLVIAQLEEAKNSRGEKHKLYLSYLYLLYFFVFDEIQL